MNRRYLRSHLSDQAVDRSLVSNNGRELGTTADLLADIAEFDARKLYRPAGYASMFAYCVGHLRRSEVAAYKRIRAARAARRFPAIFDAIAQGRLHLSGVVLLAPYLTEHSAGELLAAATHKTTKEVERLLAERYPRPDVPTLVAQQAPGPVGQSPRFEMGPDELTLRSVGESQDQVSGHNELTLRSVPGPLVAPPAEDRSSLKPLAPQRYALQVTVDQETYEALRYAQELLSHELPARDVATVLAMALKALIPELEQRKFAATANPRPPRRGSSAHPRHIPADVQRAVWERDQGQCTFVSEQGHRCEARKFVEFDHVQEVARGGEASIAGIRLRCRAHNQYAAECTFGSEFMRHKRIAAAEKRLASKASAVEVREQPGPAIRWPRQGER
jgi:hypothetical protein